MIIAIQGTRTFNDYSVFLRAMGTALSMLPEEDKEVLICSAGPHQVNSLALEFANVSERGFKARGIKVKMLKVPPKWIRDNIYNVGYFAFFSNPKEAVSDLVDFAKAKDIEIGVYRY
jgi:hypothetical protein